MITLLLSEPSWFDYISLLVTVGSIFGAYFIAETVYSREKNDKKIEDISIIYSENELFINNLKSLQTPIKNQISAIDEYLTKKDFRMKLYAEIQVDFLQFINIKDIYRKYGFNNKTKVEKINELMTSLYALYDFRESLRSEIRTYIEKYNYHEDKFYSYRFLLYTKYFQLCNERSMDMSFKSGIKRWSFDKNDKFMIEYSELTFSVFKDEEVMIENNLISRTKLIEKFIKPLRLISAKYVPEDYNAIEINQVSNEVIHAYNDMEHITENHFKVLEGYKSSLIDVNEKIDLFIRMRKQPL